jgi:predicted HTH transcriptional regulator
MTDDLRSRAYDNEDNFVERKSPGIKPAEIRATLCAFANTTPEGRTAVLFIGISDKGASAGCGGKTEEVQNRVRECAHDCYPAIDYRCEIFDLDGASVVAVEVLPSKNRPHFAAPAYIRVGASTVKASEAQFNELVWSRNSKTAAILKFKGQVVTVESIDHVIGTTQRTGPLRHIYELECRVRMCDTHRVELEQINNGAIYSEALDRIEVTMDHNKYRPKLVIYAP